MRSPPSREGECQVDCVSPLPSPPLPDDVLTKDAGECVICLEELLQGDTIARLPCLCIYHKRYCTGTGSKGTQPDRWQGDRRGQPKAQQHGGDTLSSLQLYRFMV